MKAGALRAKLYVLDVDLSSTDGRLKYSAPDGVLTSALLADMQRQKCELVVILEAEAEHDQLHRRIFELVDAAEANDLYGAHEEAERQRAEAQALVEGLCWDASQRLLELLGDEAFAELDRGLLGQDKPRF